MSHLTNHCWAIPSDIDHEELKEDIATKLIPEFEWCDEWFPCSPVVTSVRRRDGVHWFLQPFLVSVAGASVPSALPVRMRKDGDAMLQEVREFYRQHYGKVDLPPIKVHETKPGKNGHGKRKAGAH